jgi:hypothetical protein
MQNNVETLGKRRKVNKGSSLARLSLKEALGDDDAFYSSQDNSSWKNVDEEIDFDRDYSREDRDNFYS